MCSTGPKNRGSPKDLKHSHFTLCFCKHCDGYSVIHCNLGNVYGLGPMGVWASAKNAFWTLQTETKAVNTWEVNTAGVKAQGLLTKQKQNASAVTCGLSLLTQAPVISVRNKGFLRSLCSNKLATLSVVSNTLCRKRPKLLSLCHLACPKAPEHPATELRRTS